MQEYDQLMGELENMTQRSCKGKIMTQIANKNARDYVQNLELFKGSNLFSETIGEYYVVYSYGHHYPMLVHSKRTGCWFRNKDRYSVSTSKQIGQCTPYDVDLMELPTRELKDIIDAAERC